MNIKQLRWLIHETIRNLNESAFSVNADVDRMFNQAGVYPPKMTNIGGSRYEGEIDKGWTLGYDEKSGEVFLNGKPFESLFDAAKYFKQNKSKSPLSKNKTARIISTDDGRIIKIGGKSFNVHDIAEEEYRKNNPNANDDDVEDYVLDGDISHIDARIMREYGVTHVIDPEVFEDENPRPVEEWLSFEY